MPDFIELHTRSAFSFLRGAAQPEELVRRAAELDMPTIAVTDRDGFYGSVRAHGAAVEAGISTRVGCELTLADGSALPVLVGSQKGYRNLSKLLTRSKLRATKGAGVVHWSELEESSEGLFCMTGDRDGPVQRALANRDPAAAEHALRECLRIFGRDRVYVAVQRHRLRGEQGRGRALMHLAATYDLPLLATNSPAYALPAQRMLHDAFICLRHHTHLDAAGTLLNGNSQAYLKSESEMRALFCDLPEALDNTLRLADQLEFTLENLGYRFPDYTVPDGEDVPGFLRRRTFEGAKKRYGLITKKIRRQLEHELHIITKLGFCGYFLVVWDIVNFARNEDILVQGRGSAANSAVCYSLGITAVDPIGSRLLFERFLSEGRDTWPDIDLDLPSGDGRERVIQEVYRRFAPHGAAMTANVITYRGRSAMREMGKVLNLPEDILGRFSDLHGSGDYPHTLEFRDHLVQAGIPSDHPRLPALIKLYQMVYRLPRHLGQHSGGMILADGGLDNVVPLENASMPGRVVAQWDKDDCADLGIIKVDLLGLGMMAAIQETVTLCEQRRHPVDLAQIPKDDPAVFDILSKADTIGLFQVESRAQQASLPLTRPRCFYDVAVQAALIRPGPIVGNLVHPYINRRNGREPIDYIHPDFKPVLERTLGVPLFHEQVLKMAMIIAGFNGSEAEELRRALSFNRSKERMEKVMTKLRAAMNARQVEITIQDRIVNAIQSFALYGFPESHAISFGLLAYASAWLKVHRPVEFYVSLFNQQPMGFYRPATLVEDARRHGIRVRPVCVSRSRVECIVDSDHAFRLGLRYVSELSRASAERIVAENDCEPWCDLQDFLTRSHVNKTERRVLAGIGALNGLAAHRRDALWQVEGALLDADDLFAGCVREDSETPYLLPAMRPAERLQADYQGLGLSTGPHPMAYIRESLPGIWRAIDLPQACEGTRIWIGGLVICRQRPGTAKGHVFVSLEDETGIANAFVPAPVFEKNRLVITQESFLRIRGRVQNNQGVISIYSEQVKALPYNEELGNQSHDFH